jgi:hypothetical protein
MVYKEEYKDEEKLNLSNKVYITKEVWQILNKYYLKQRKSGRQVSKAKIVCNLIIKNL